MGCCFSSDDDKLSQHGEPTERTTLLGNPVSNSTNRTSYSDETGAQFTSAFGHKGDEQSALNKILHQTATNVIDVSAMDSHLEQNEYLERSRHYQQRVNSNAAQRAPLVARQRCLLGDNSAPEKILAASPISHEEVTWMEQWTSKVQSALGDIKVAHKEDLVVQFGIP